MSATRKLKRKSPAARRLARRENVQVTIFIPVRSQKREGENLSWFKNVPMSARELRKIMSHTGIRPEYIAMWSADGKFPVPAVTAEAVDGWHEGTLPIPDDAGAVLRLWREEFDHAAEAVCQWHIDHLQELHGGWVRNYGVTFIIYPDFEKQLKYDKVTMRDIPLEMRNSFIKYACVLLGVQGIKSMLIPFEEEKYFAFLAANKIEHSDDAIDAWSNNRALEIEKSLGGNWNRVAEMPAEGQ